MTGDFTVLRGGLLLDIGRQDSYPADILIEGDTIREIGAPGMAAPEGATVEDASGRLILPGLVNAHTHGHGALAKGLGDRWSLELLLNAAPWTGGGFTHEDKRIAARLNAAEMVLKGCTAAYDMFFEFPTATPEGIAAIGAGYRDVGMRAVIAPMMADIPFFRSIPGLMDLLPAPHRDRIAAMEAAPFDTHLAQCRRIVESWAFDLDAVRPALGPTIPLMCTDDFLRGCRDLARDHGLGIQMHLAESPVQAVSAARRYETTLAARLDALGLIDARFTAAHGVWLTDADMAMMAERGASVAHNPGSNLRLGSGIARVRAMRDAGLCVGIGTDGSGSSDNQNMFEAMRMAAFVSRVVTKPPETWFGTWEVLEMATAGSAQALGMGDAIGRIAPGYKADMVLLDLASVNYVPLNNPANQVVNCEDSSAVSAVMIGGRMVLRDRRFTGFDFDKLRADVAAAVARIQAANAGTRAEFEAVARFVSHHCVGLCPDAPNPQNPPLRHAPHAR
ncbi:guanine deaminase [Roseivivax lentus]|uniref:Guanine deaminase n=1 Tax=Roseivivax lentus TaxID=633194 RepID=A0A1N7KBC7_9RHOB|nr:amidohydrolase [Roseivivax lentus]SIS58839.1 guanine deaminase [Roseivivax lentus]